MTSIVLLWLVLGGLLLAAGLAPRHAAARRARTAAAALLALALTGCGAAALHAQAATATAIATSANAGLPLLVERYRQENLDRIAAARTRAEADAGRADVRARWRPIWDAWRTLRSEQDAWATFLEGGGTGASALPALEHAFCALLVVWPSSIPAVPLAPIVCSGGAP